MHFGASGYQLWFTSISWEVDAVGNFLAVLRSRFLFLVELWKVMDVEFAICNGLNNGFVDPGVTGENIMQIMGIKEGVISTLCIETNIARLSSLRNTDTHTFRFR